MQIYRFEDGCRMVYRMNRDNLSPVNHQRIAALLVKVFTAMHGSHIFNTVFKTARQLAPFWCDKSRPHLLQTTLQPYFFKDIYIYIYIYIYMRSILRGLIIKTAEILSRSRAVRCIPLSLEAHGYLHKLAHPL